jgi:ERCC4-type nuclease
MPRLIIAKGENSLCSELLALQVQYHVENLPVGDIEIRDAADNPIAIIERKTVADLMASIIDGRYKEQSTRLQAITAAQVWWVIEGSPVTYRRDAQAQSRMCAAIASLGLLRNFTPVRTTNTHETALLLKKLLAKAEELPQVRAASGMQEGGEVDSKLGVGYRPRRIARLPFHTPATTDPHPFSSCTIPEEVAGGKSPLPLMTSLGH